MMKTKRNNLDSLSLSQLERLYQSGMSFDPKTNRWLDRFFEFLRFKRKHRLTTVKAASGMNRKLRNWIGSQRKSKTIPERIRLLHLIGFDQNPTKSRWRKNFKELKKIKTEYRLIQITSARGFPHRLRIWIENIRRRKRNLSLSLNRINMLEKIDFQWEARNSAWMERYRDLQAFHKKYGHSRVPNQWPSNKPLARWVQTQRHNKNQLSPMRRQLLERIDFVWKPPRTRITRSLLQQGRQKGKRWQSRKL